jgi:hypothetical protein
MSLTTKKLAFLLATILYTISFYFSRRRSSSWSIISNPAICYFLRAFRVQRLCLYYAGGGLGEGRDDDGKLGGS